MSGVSERPSYSSIAIFNLKCFSALIMGVLGYYAWPDAVEDASWGMMSFFFWCACLGLIVESLHILVRHYRFVRKTREFETLGNEMKSGAKSADGFKTTDGLINK